MTSRDVCVVVLAVVGACALACGDPDAGGGTGASGDPTAPVLEQPRLTNNSLTTGVEGVITGSIGFSDSDGNLTGLYWSIEQPSGAVTAEQLLEVSVSGATEGTIEFPGFVITAEATGDHYLLLQAVDADAQRSERTRTKLFVNDLSGVNDVCSKTNTDCTGQGICINLDADACTYLDSVDLTIEQCARVSESKQPVCVSNYVNEEDTQNSTSCNLISRWSNPTRLKVDCRCPVNRVKEPECKRPYNQQGMTDWGSGPHLYSINGYDDSRQGSLIGREWFIPLAWNTSRYRDQSMIFAFDLDTGDRRHVSGAYNDPREGYREVGEGPSLLEITQVVTGPDGMLYAVGGVERASEPTVWKIDPVSGDREIVFDATDEETYTLCDNGNRSPAGRRTVQLTNRSFAMDDDGNFYFANISYGLPGAAIVKIDAVTKACSYVSLVVNPNTPDNVLNDENIGAGYDDFTTALRGIYIKDGKLYAMPVTAKLFEIDLATGDRTMISWASPGGVGEGPVGDEGMGDNWVTWDEGHGMFWTIGAVSGTTAIAIDPETGDRHALPCWHPTKGLSPVLCDETGFLNPGFHNDSGFIVDPLPPYDIFFIYDDVAMLRYDVTTGQSNIVSL